MSDRRLEVFHAVASQMSFTRAAELLGTSQPAVTFQIRQLEDHFLTRLFDRSHGRVTLTPAGELMRQYTERVLHLTVDLRARLAELHAEPCGILHVGATPSAAEYYAPSVLARFRRLHPQVRPQLTVVSGDDIDERIDERVLDVGFSELPPRTQAQCEVRQCAEDELVVAFAPDHPWIGQEAIAAARLVEQPMVGREAGVSRLLFDDYLAGQGVDPASIPMGIDVDRLASAKVLAELGAGFAVLPAAAVQREVRAGLLVARPLAPPLRRPLYLILPRERVRTPLVMRFGQFMAEHASH